MLSSRIMKSILLLKKHAAPVAKIEFSVISDKRLAELPCDRGIYLFKNRNTAKIDYIGTATGRKGLKQRIAKQHLNVNYVQSVFRIKVAKARRLSSEKKTVDFIKRNYSLGFLTIPEHVSIVKALEQLLIFEYSSKYNSETNIK
jgi:hypothetical protein